MVKSWYKSTQLAGYKSISSDVLKKSDACHHLCFFRSLKCPAQIPSYDIISHLHAIFQSHEMIWNIHNWHHDHIMTISWLSIPIISHEDLVKGIHPPKRSTEKHRRSDPRYQSVDRLQQLLVLHEIQVPGGYHRGAVIFFEGTKKMIMFIYFLESSKWSRKWVASLIW